MALWGIFISAFLLGFSGAMMPGPMLGITIDGSLRKGYIAGPLVVLGHGILEMVLVITMVIGLKDFFSNTTVAGLIGLFGGAFLCWMGYQMIKSAVKKTVSLEKQKAKDSKGKSLVLMGAVVSATNPYFILWWASTGAEFLRRSYTLGIIGVLVFFVGHILSDLTWFSAVSIAFSRGKRIISDKAYRLIIVFLGLFLIVFSIYFITSGCRMLWNSQHFK